MIELHLEGEIVPKARPRCRCIEGVGQAYNPENYKSWKKAAAKDFSLQARELNLQTSISKTLGVQIELYGKHNRGGDADNVAGAILDALQDAKVLAKDNMVAVPSLLVALSWSKDPPTAKIFIEDCLWRNTNSRMRLMRP